MNKQKIMQLDAMTLVIDDLKGVIAEMENEEADPSIERRLYSIGWNLNKAKIHLNILTKNSNPPAED